MKDKTRTILGCILVVVAIIGMLSMLSYCTKVATCDDRGDCHKYLKDMR